MKDYDKRISEYEDRINELKKEKNILESLKPRQRLAELIHDKMCTWNHTDGCSWFYEKWEDTGFAKNKYLEKADNILDEHNFETAIKIISKL